VASARSTLDVLAKITKPKPRDRFVVVSFITTASATSPNWLKNARREAGTVERTHTSDSPRGRTQQRTRRQRATSNGTTK
jgi:hypothetical protein